MHRLPALSAAVLAAALLVSAAPAQGPAAGWKAGAAAVDITPQGPVWLGGFPKRTGPSQGVAERIHAKALALEDGAGSRVVIVTLDLVYVTRDMRQAVERQASRQFGLAPSELMINVSHTHSAPALNRALVMAPHDFYGTPVAEEWVAKADAYRAWVDDRIVEAVGRALAAERAATLDYGHARAGFAMNRRLPLKGEMLHEANPDGPVDLDVPVLRIATPEGRVFALLFGYACHNTAVTTVCPLLNGDYAGYAQDDLEADYPGATALFVQGGAGDQNPYPRGPLEFAQRYGRQLADAVEAALQVKVRHPVGGPLKTALGYAALDYAETSRADLERRTRIGSDNERAHAAKWLKRLQTDGRLPGSYPCPVQVIRFGPDLTLVAIGGETTVGYALRLKRELSTPACPLWFAGYSNDVFGYLGTREVLAGGGYEGYQTNAGSDVHPGPYALDVEDRVIAEVHELLRDLNND